jgi:VanZ family protein
MTAIFVGSSVPERPSTETMIDISMHEIGYFGLTILLIRALSAGRWLGVTAGVLLLAFTVAVGYGAILEWYQSFIPTRTADIRDLRANALGAFVAAAVVKACGIIRRL